MFASMVKRFIKELALAAVIVVIVFGCVYLFSRQQTTPTNEQTIIDSLQTEIIGLQIDNGRYEIILNRLWEADSIFVMQHTGEIE